MKAYDHIVKMCDVDKKIEHFIMRGAREEVRHNGQTGRFWFEIFVLRNDIIGRIRSNVRDTCQQQSQRTR
jgi:hypothetical protein